jgi:pimeloyl-ACP methyl ester carboxylesterase
LATNQPALADVPPSAHPLVLAGDDDPIVPLGNGRILTRLLPRARLEIVAGGGHLFVLERPAEIARLVAGFLDDPEIR